ncbi:error-prone DNA polymerase [Devosia sp. ZB163]|uniref:error-prone DNA polymerase n=1 Tax=Devosia sp. ZB163 TaxID=3025938 RepID=UPI002362D869|nr:error-prone DNA polymerase [Devosia sp. ZB163]MDC9823985.1 error-prone DNA polymerase [Devosia sp. ZB163]
MPYVELISASNFTFLSGASHPAELLEQAACLNLGGIGICDRNSFAGVVRGHVAARVIWEAMPTFRYLVGVRLSFVDGTPDIIAYPTDRAAYGRLCFLLTTGNRRALKGECHLRLADLGAAADGQLFIVSAEFSECGEETLERVATFAPGSTWLAASCAFKGQDRARLNRIADMAQRHGVPMIATNDVLFHAPDRKILHDVVTCIREHMTLEAAGRRLQQNAERHIKSPQEMERLFEAYPEALAETGRFASRIAFSLDELKYNYPEETIGNGETAQETLERLSWAGAARRYPDGVPERVRLGLEHELQLIDQMRYASYFLTVHDLVRFAREERGILCQGRGSAANSVVCFCLGVTEVDPMLVDLLFERFVSTERDEPPDIDVDFEHERREEVMQYLYQKYGRHRCALTATVTTYRAKGAIREVSKVFGLSDDMIARLNGMSWGWNDTGITPERLQQNGFDPDDLTLMHVLTVVSVLMGFPRHLGQHVGGFVITRDRLDNLIPVMNAAMADRTTVEWDKDDLDALGILKVDVLALGMLSCIRRAFELMHIHYGTALTLTSVPSEDPRTYTMIQRADTIGVFQIESRAQMSMLPRLKPAKFYDLVIEVAIVRPGPIQGGMVHPYLKRRLGLEPVSYPSPELEAVLKKTYGVPLFQEQAMKIAIVGAGFSPGAADQLRRSMATFKRTGGVGKFKTDFIGGMRRNGYTQEFAEACFKQIEGFGSYGFPESHAASFALLVYVSCWLKCHYPDAFACALLNSQPMGFYAPSQIVRDAQEHGVEVRNVDINHSDLVSVLEPGTPGGDRVWQQHASMRDDIRSTNAIRLGLGFVKGLSDDDANLIVARRGRGYDSVRDLWLRTRLLPATLQKLADADAFTSLGLNRRDAQWAVLGLQGSDGAEMLPLFAAAGRPEHREEEDANLPAMPPGEQVIHDYRTLSLSLKAHPVSFLRDTLTARHIVSAGGLRDVPAGRVITVAGVVLVRQRPGTASGVIFASLEDETGLANIIVWPKVFEKYRSIVLGSRLMAVRGEVQKEGLVIHVIAREVFDMTPMLLDLASGLDIGEGMIANADEGKTGPHGSARGGDKRQDLEAERKRVHDALPSGRNFH